MKGGAALAARIAVCGMLAMTGCDRQEDHNVRREELETGRELFSHYCSGCHPDGRNVLYPQKSLHRIDLTANGITTPAGIVAKMRHPDRGMKRFDRATISDRDALAIARYIFATFQ